MEDEGEAGGREVRIGDVFEGEVHVNGAGGEGERGRTPEQNGEIALLSLSDLKLATAMVIMR